MSIKYEKKNSIQNANKQSMWYVCIEECSKICQWYLFSSVSLLCDVANAIQQLLSKSCRFIAVLQKPSLHL